MLNILVTMVLKLSTCWLAAAHNSTDSKSQSTAAGQLWTCHCYDQDSDCHCCCGHTIT